MDEKTKIKRKIWVASIIVVFFLCVCVGSSVYKLLTLSRAKLLPTDTATATLPPLPAPPFSEIRSTFQDMTEKERMEYLPTLHGLIALGWGGWIEGIEPQGKTIVLRLDMDPPGDPEPTVEVLLEISEELAGDLQVDDKITFSGLITSIGVYSETYKLYITGASVQLVQ